MIMIVTVIYINIIIINIIVQIKPKVISRMWKKYMLLEKSNLVKLWFNMAPDGEFN